MPPRLRPRVRKFLGLCNRGIHTGQSKRGRTREIIQLNKNSGVKSEEEAVRRWPAAPHTPRLRDSGMSERFPAGRRRTKKNSGAETKSEEEAGPRCPMPMHTPGLSGSSTDTMRSQESMSERFPAGKKGEAGRPMQTPGFRGSGTDCVRSSDSISECFPADAVASECPC